MKIATFQKIALALSIIVVLNLVFNFGLSTFYKAPSIDNFCGKETRQIYTTQDSCEEVGGEWIDTFPKNLQVVAPIDIERQPKAYCNARAACSADYQDVRDFYNRNVFIVLVILGVLSIGAGFAAVAVKAVSTGFLFGGFLSILIASMRYWSGMNEYLRFVVLVTLLAALIFLGYKKLKDRE